MHLGLSKGQDDRESSDKMNETITLDDYGMEVATEVTDSNNIWRNLSTYESSLSCDEFLPSGSALAATWFQTTVYFFYSIIFVIALLGNGLVCYVVFSSPRMKTVTNFFIVNLAVGDILMAVFCVPTSFISTLILQYWPFGHELCPIVNYSQAVSVLVSAYTLVAISIDRYVAIMWPLKPRMSKTQAKLLILAVWSIALIVSSPIAVVSRLHQPNDHYRKCDQFICKEDWPSTQQRYHYSIALLVLQYLVPLIVLMFTYSSIAIRVWGKHPPGEAENTRDQRMARSKRKMIKMMMTVVIAFTVCWLPFNVLTLVLDNNNERVNNWKGLPFAWTALHWLSMSHSCYNPVIYCWMNARFRTGFITALSRLPCVRKLFNDPRQGTYNTSMAGIALTGFEAGNHSVLRRINTCTTYVSVKKKTNGSHGVPVRSASFRNTETIRTVQRPLERHFIRLDCQNEEQM
ncbi:RYamide receptor [Venturia canescens]|uniref:RYamide receptor n=1 Tax=Venturia canescens TaxID=32260 RepID=UPI001C9CA04B|nr:RYamide receptor [Venturia canescens]